MDEALLFSLVAAGFTVAFFHAALPTHWLPFVVTARAQRWTTGRTLAVTVIAGAGHVVITTLLGVVVVWLGMSVDRITGTIFPRLGGALLALVGLFYIYRGATGRPVHVGAHGHGHDDHDDHDHSHDIDHELVVHARPRTTDRAAILGLLTLLTLSPCEAFLPVYVSAARFGWMGFAVSSGVLAVATVAGMVTFTSLTLAGMERLRLDVLERYEGIILGSVLLLLGAAFVLLER